MDKKIILFILGNKNDVSEDLIYILKNMFLKENPLYSESEVRTEFKSLDDIFYDFEVALIVNNKPIHYFMICLINHIRLTIPDLILLNKNAENILLSENYSNGLKDKKGLEAVLGNTENSFFGIDVCPTVIDKAVELWFKIAQKQLFHNGNKRTALLSALILLNVNGYNFKGHSYGNLNDDGVRELYNISLKIANHDISKKQLKKYVLDNVSIDFKIQSDIFYHMMDVLKDKGDK